MLIVCLLPLNHLFASDETHNRAAAETCCRSIFMKPVSQSCRSGYEQECVTASCSQRKTVRGPPVRKQTAQQLPPPPPPLQPVCSLRSSPCRRVCGGAEKPQPVVQYKPQRSYNRSAVGIRREFTNVPAASVSELRCNLSAVCRQSASVTSSGPNSRT